MAVSVEDHGCESEWTADEPSSGAEGRAFQALLGGARPRPSARAAQGRMQLRACPLQRPASEEPSSHEQQSSEDGEDLGAQGGRSQGDTRADAATYTGVRCKARANPYEASIRWQKQKYHLGYFPTAVSAAKAYDWAARLVGKRRKLNFGREVDLGTPPSTEGAALLRARVSQMGGTAALERAAEARYCGVYRDSRTFTNPFYAQVQLRGKQYHLGNFADAHSAARAYDWAVRLIGDGKPLNFDASDDLGAPPTTTAAAQLHKDVAAAAASQVARPLGFGEAPRGASRSPRLAPMVASAAAPQQPGVPSPAAGAAAKRPARAAPPPGPPPAAKKRRAPPELKPAPRGAGEPSRTDSSLASELRVLLRFRGLREDDLALGELGEGALRDITADVRRAAGPAGESSSQEAAASLSGYSALELKARLAVNMRLRATSEDGVRLDLLTGEVGRGLLLDVLSARVQSGGSAA